MFPVTYPHAYQAVMAEINDRRRRGTSVAAEKPLTSSSSCHVAASCQAHIRPQERTQRRFHAFTASLSGGLRKCSASVLCGEM